MLPTAPTLITPFARPRIAFNSSCACSASLCSNIACGINASPSAVNCIPLVWRSKSGAPTDSSSRLIDLLSAGCVMFSMVAARPRLPAETIVVNIINCCRLKLNVTNPLEKDKGRKTRSRRAPGAD